MKDAELNTCLKALERGDMAAFERLYEELKTPVYTILLRITGDRWLAEDLLQEFFVRLYQAPPAAARKPRAYLFQMARNLAIDSLRRAEVSVPADAEPAEELWQAHHEMRMDLEAAMGQLDLLERQLVVLHLNGGLKFREVAQIVGLPLGTAYSRYRKAIGKLRVLLDGGIL